MTPATSGFNLMNFLYSDAAVLHFVQIGRAFQMELVELSPCRPEAEALNLLPDLCA